MFFSFFLLALLALVFVGKVLGTLGLIGSSTGAESGRRFEEKTVENPTADDKIAIIDVEGIITSQPFNRNGRNMVEFIDDQLKAAAKDAAVKAVILKVDSPGGEVMASDDIARSLQDFQEKNHKPVIAAMGGLAASGGYYVSAPCQWIVANELTITGSIGVIMHGINYRGLMDKLGVQPQVFKSGRFKDMMSGSKKPEEVDPEEKQMIQDMIMETYGKFKTVVAEGRKRAETKNQGKGRSLAKNWADFADGRVLTGTKAHDLGFVDELGNFEKAVESTKRIAGITGNARLIRYQEPFEFGSLFSLFGKTDTKSLKIDLGLDLPKLRAGIPYFLYTVSQ